ncbi:hypothetical protein MRX96_012541 [Rhipicephalus microplus]
MCAPEARPNGQVRSRYSDVFRVRCRMRIEHNNEPFVISADRRVASAECARLHSRWPPIAATFMQRTPAPGVLLLLPPLP